MTFRILGAVILFAWTGLVMAQSSADSSKTNSCVSVMDTCGSDKDHVTCGFIKEGYRRKAVYFDNDWHDHVVYAINPEDIGLKGSKPTIKI